MAFIFEVALAGYVSIWLQMYTNNNILVKQLIDSCDLYWPDKL